MNKTVKRVLSSVLAATMIAGSMAAACVSAGATSVDAETGFLLDDCETLDNWSYNQAGAIDGGCVDFWDQDLYTLCTLKTVSDFTDVAKIQLDYKGNYVGILSDAAKSAIVLTSYTGEMPTGAYDINSEALTTYGCKVSDAELKSTGLGMGTQLTIDYSTAGASFDRTKVTGFAIYSDLFTSTDTKSDNYFDDFYAIYGEKTPEPPAQLKKVTLSDCDTAENWTWHDDHAAVEGGQEIWWEVHDYVYFGDGIDLTGLQSIVMNMGKGPDDNGGYPELFRNQGQGAMYLTSKPGQFKASGAYGDSAGFGSDEAFTTYGCAASAALFDETAGLECVEGDNTFAIDLSTAGENFDITSVTGIFFTFGGSAHDVFFYDISAMVADAPTPPTPPVPVADPAPEGNLLKVVYTSNNKDNQAGYQFVDLADAMVYTGWKLTYDVYLEDDAAGIGGIELDDNYGNFARDNAEYVDQNGVSGHPKSDISDYAYSKWYHREMNLPSNWNGSGFAEFFAVLAYDEFCEGTAIAYFDNIKYVNENGEEQEFFFKNGEDEYSYLGTYTGDRGSFSDYTDTNWENLDVSVVTYDSIFADRKVTEAANTMLKIDNIDDANISFNTVVDIECAEKAYAAYIAAYGEENAADITNYADLTAARSAYNEFLNNQKLADAASTIEKITAIGTVTLQSESLINAAEKSLEIFKSRYTDDDLALITNLQTLNDAIAAYDELYATAKATALNDAFNKINAIGVVTLDSKDAIEAAEAAVKAYTDAYGAESAADVINADTLSAARTAYNDLVAAKEKADAAAAVIDKITAIGTVTLESEAAIKDAETARDAFTTKYGADSISDITNATDLLNARTAYDTLVTENQMEEEVKAIGEYIDAIGTVTVDSKDAIETAEKALNEYKEKYGEAGNGKLSLLTNITVLIDARKAYNELVSVKYGDVNGDGNIDSADALAVLQFTVGKAELDDTQKKAADVNGDGTVDSADALAILQKVVGKITAFDVEK